MRARVTDANFADLAEASCLLRSTLQRLRDLEKLSEPSNM